jgi:ribonuclease P/MRP protein subunit RPP40
MHIQSKKEFFANCTVFFFLFIKNRESGCKAARGGDIDTLKKVQEKAVKMVSGLKGTTYQEKCKELGLNTLLERGDAQDMSLVPVHKFLTEKSGSDMFRQIAANGRAGTRQAAGGHGLSVQYARTDPRKYSFAVRTVEKWNRLPEEVKSAPTGKAFKEKLKRL